MTNKYIKIRKFGAKVLAHPWPQNGLVPAYVPVGKPLDVVKLVEMLLTFEAVFGNHDAFLRTRII